jgi:methionyl aminopeptidase
VTIRNDAEREGMAAVGRLVGEALRRMAAAVEPGVTTAALDEVGAAFLRGQGAESAPQAIYSFPGFCCISVNDEVVHGVPGSRKIEAGDIVKLDVTVEKDGYMADAARTVIVSGGSDIAERLMRCARSAFKKALAQARVGRRVNEIGRAIEREVHGHGFEIVRGLDGHGIGRTIHEPPSVPNYFDPAQKDVLTDGLVITIEPIICAGSGRAVEGRDGWTIRTADGSLAAHYEHTLVVTSAGPVLLTA